MNQTHTKKRNFITPFYILSIFCFISLYVENKYFNIVNAKGHALWLVVIIGGLLIVTFDRFKSFSNLRIFDYSLILYCISMLFSTLFSNDILGCFLGNLGWYLGLLTWLGLLLMYLYVSRNSIPSDNLWLIILIVNTIIFCIGILHSAKVDVFNLHQRISPKQFFSYMTTIGNTNMYSTYLLMLLSLIFCFLLFSSDNTTLIIFYIFLELGLINLILCGTDSTFPGLLLICLFVLPIIATDKTKMHKTGIVIWLYALAALLIRIFPCFSDKNSTIEGVNAWIISVPGILVLSVLGLFLFLMPKAIPTKIIYILQIVLVVFALLLIILQIPSFNKKWGNRRGEIWIQSIEEIKTESTKDKIIGKGPEQLSTVYAKLSQKRKENVNSAHNEFLQVMLSTGFLGLIFYLCMWISLFYTYFSKKDKSHDAFCFFIPLTGYFGQCFFNSPNPLDTAVFILITALFFASLKNNDI